MSWELIVEAGSGLEKLFVHTQVLGMDDPNMNIDQGVLFQYNNELMN